MIGRMNSDGQAKVLKSQGKTTVRPVIGNHGVQPADRALAEPLPTALAAPRAPASTPRGGGRAGRLSPPALRRVHHSGSRRVEK